MVPPPQFRKPDFPTSEAPIKTTVRPVTRGGKIFRSFLAGTKDIAISKKEHTKNVPISLPYALNVSPSSLHCMVTHSGHACRVTVPSAFWMEGHVPSAYRALKTAVAVDRLANDVPTTVINPVPI